MRLSWKSETKNILFECLKVFLAMFIVVHVFYVVMLFFWGRGISIKAWVLIVLVSVLVPTTGTFAHGLCNYLQWRKKYKLPE